jgi:hypothetical protein
VVGCSGCGLCGSDDITGWMSWDYIYYQRI